MSSSTISNNEIGDKSDSDSENKNEHSDPTSINKSAPKRKPAENSVIKRIDNKPKNLEKNLPATSGCLHYPLNEIEKGSVSKFA